MDPYDNEMMRAFAREVAVAQEMERLRRQYAWIDENSTYAQLLREAARIEEQERQLRNAMGPAAYVNHLAEIARVAQDTKERLTRLGIGNIGERIAADLDLWRTETQGLTERLGDATALERQISNMALTTFEESFRRTTAVAEHWGGADRAGIAAMMLAPTEGFGRYARGATRRILETESAEQRAAGEIGLALADSVLEATDELHEAIVEEDRESGNARVRIAVAQPLVPGRVLELSIRVEGFFTTQEQDALAHVPLLVGEGGQPISTLDTSRRSAQQIAFGKLVTGCVKEARIHGRPLPIKLGETVTDFCVELGFIDASDETGLGRFVDGMYFTLYEATDNKRLLHAYLGDDRLAAVDRVKRLRDRVQRHVFERQTPQAIAHQAPEIVEALHAFGLPGLPRTAAERLLLHDALIDQGTALLNELIEAIRH